MTVTKIQKLTPPQITALRDAFPGLVQAGILSTTRSIATFDLGEHTPAHPRLQGWEPTPDALDTLLCGAHLAGKISGARVEPIVAKLRNRKDVVVQ